jgi:hypothetical protein
MIMMYIFCLVVMASRVFNMCAAASGIQDEVSHQFRMFFYSTSQHRCHVLTNPWPPWTLERP